MVKLDVQMGLEDCLKACLDTVQRYLVAYDELERNKVGINDLITVIRYSQTEVDAIDSLMQEFSLTRTSSEALLEMPLRKLDTNENRTYYESVFVHLNALDLNNS